jgi:hypothetical protein
MLFGAVVILIASVTIVRQTFIRPIPFDPARWRSGDARIRFRMKDSLVEKYAGGEFQTREQVDSSLGPADAGRNTDEYRRFQLKEWYGNPWYLMVRFDDRRVSRKGRKKYSCKYIAYIRLA